MMGLAKGFLCHAIQKVFCCGPAGQRCIESDELPTKIPDRGAACWSDGGGGPYACFWSLIFAVRFLHNGRVLSPFSDLLTAPASSLFSIRVSRVKWLAASVGSIRLSVHLGG